MVAFVKARLDERESAARAALSDPASTLTGSGVRLMGGQLAIMPSAMADGLVQHFVLNGPHLVLREVGAARAMLDLCERVIRDDDGHDYYSDGWAGLGVAKFALGCLSAPYSDHPDYRPDWIS